jgi:hypothetical protein
MLAPALVDADGLVHMMLLLIQPVGRNA